MPRAILLAEPSRRHGPIRWGDYPQTVESYLRHHRHCAGDRASLFRTALCLWSRPVVGFLHLAPLSLTVRQAGPADLRGAGILDHPSASLR